MKQTEDWLDNLKLRVSYGSVGNARVNSYWRQDYKMESSANRQYYLNETVQSALKLQNTLRNENLTWETKLSSNVGIDASLFNSRLNVTVDFYNDITKDLILRMDLPSNSGYEYQYQNVGRSTNRGVELTLIRRERVKFLQLPEQTEKLQQQPFLGKSCQMHAHLYLLLEILELRILPSHWR